MSRRPITTVAVPLALVVALAAGAWWWTAGADDRPRLEIGGQAQDPERMIETLPTHAAHVMVPWGRIDLEVTDPLEEIPSGAEADVRPPRGGRVVGVRVAPDTDRLTPVSASPATAGVLRLRNPTYTLVADGRDYPLTGLEIWSDRGVHGQPPAAWVGVEGTPEELAIAVDFDGERQVVDLRTGQVEKGRFEAWYPRLELRQQPRECGEPTWTRGHRSLHPSATTCSVDSMLRLPYVDGLGWAPEGSEWLVVGVEAHASDAFVHQPSGTSYEGDDDPTVRFRLDGAEPEVVDGGRTDTPWSLPHWVVFETSDDARGQALEIVQHMEGDSYEGDGPATSSVEVTWQVEL